MHKCDSITIKREGAADGPEKVRRETDMKESAAVMRKARKRSERIVNAALELFCEKGIEETSIEEIAASAEVGSATIYRYYETKAELAVRTGVACWKRIESRYLSAFSSEEYARMSGLDQIERILDVLVRIFDEETSSLKFLQEFDVFVRRNGIQVERLREYEDCIMSLKPRVTDALEKGLFDGTLSFVWSPEEVCYSLAHTMFSLMKKLAWNGSMLSLDAQVALGLQVRITKDLLVKGLKAEGE